ncbi:MutL DNA mismatch repair protein, partial [Reticulomyxa filosa]
LPEWQDKTKAKPDEVEVVSSKAKENIDKEKDEAKDKGEDKEQERKEQKDESSSNSGKATPELSECICEPTPPPSPSPPLKFISAKKRSFGEMTSSEKPDKSSCAIDWDTFSVNTNAMKCREDANGKNVLLGNEEKNSPENANVNATTALDSISNHLCHDVITNAENSHCNNTTAVWGMDIPNCQKLSSPDKQLAESNESAIPNQREIQKAFNTKEKERDIIDEWYQNNEQLVYSNSDPILCASIQNENGIELTKNDLNEMELFGVGQIDRRWIITKLRNFMVLIDQHAADERITLENMTKFVVDEKNGPHKFRIRQQALIPCVSLFLSAEEFSKCTEIEEILKAWGFDFAVVKDWDNSGPAAIKIHKVPILYGTCMLAEDLKEICNEWIDKHISPGKKGFVPVCVHKILASKACQSAVRFGDSLTRKKMQDILLTLRTCDQPFICAHGRPTLFPIADLTSLPM